MDIKLPKASHAEIPKDLSNRDIINISANGDYYLGDRLHSTKEMAEYLKNRFINFPPLRIYVRADHNTPAKKIKELMRLATEAGAIDVIFGSYQD